MAGLRVSGGDCAQTRRATPGRLGFWLRSEPHLGKVGKVLPGVPCADSSWERLRAMTGWDFDWCLMTYSGEAAAGITPHRDAAFASNEARGLNVSGWCDFSIWEERIEDGPTRVRLFPGDLVVFDCKRQHAAEPSPGRWSVNTWKVGPKWRAAGRQSRLL